MAVPPAMLANPLFHTPPEIARDLWLLQVMHFDFTGQIKTGQIIVHELVLHAVEKFFQLAFTLRFPIHSVIPVNFFNWCDEFTCAANNSSGHNMRNIDGSYNLLARLSKHAIGCAFDINPRINACYVLHEKSLLWQRTIPASGIYNPPAPGTLYEGHPLVQLMLDLGWAWGGKWTFPKDPQHFQIIPHELALWVT